MLGAWPWDLCTRGWVLGAHTAGDSEVLSCSMVVLDSPGLPDPAQPDPLLFGICGPVLAEFLGQVHHSAPLLVLGKHTALGCWDISLRETAHVRAQVDSWCPGTVPFSSAAQFADFRKAEIHGRTYSGAAEHTEHGCDFQLGWQQGGRLALDHTETNRGCSLVTACHVGGLEGPHWGARGTAAW